MLAVAEWLASVGQDDKLLRRVFADAIATKQRSWHWSGFSSRNAMLDELEKRAPEGELVPMLRVLSGKLADAAHPSARWHSLAADHDAEAHVMSLPDPAVATDVAVAAFAHRSRALLSVVRRLVSEYQVRAEANTRLASGPEPPAV